jgi:hypothetical protein
MNGNTSAYISECTGKNNQKWIFGIPEMNVTQTIDVKEPLPLHHHPFIEDQTVNNENSIKNELKKCTATTSKHRNIQQLSLPNQVEYWQKKPLI